MSGVDAASLRELMAQERMAARTKQRAAPTQTTRVTDEQIRTVFNMFDVTNSGTVSCDELDLMFRSVGIPADSAGAKALVEGAGHTAEGLTLEQFGDVIRKNAAAQNSQDEARHVHGLIDKDGSGYVSFENLRAALEAADARVSDEEIRDVVRYCSFDKEAGVSEKDWLEVMQFVSDIGQ